MKHVLLLILCTLSLRTFAESQEDTLLHHSKMSEVTISASYQREVMAGQTLSSKQLEALRNNSVADAVRYFSGVQIKDYGGVGGMKTVDIRSMGTNHMGVFYDGIQIGNAQNGQVDLGKFSMDNMEAITLYNGQKSSIWQSAKDFGSSGTLYLRSRQPVFTNGRTDNIRATLRGGSFGLKNISLLWEHKISEEVSSNVSGEFTDATGKYRFRYRRVNQYGKVAWDTTAVRKNGDVRAQRLEGGVNGHFSGGLWRTKAYYYGSQRGIPGAIVNNVWKNSQRQWDHNFFAQGHVEKGWLDNRLETQFKAKYSYDFMRYQNPDTTLMYIDNKFYQQELYMSSATHYRVSEPFDVSISADYLWNTLDATMVNFPHPTRHTVMVAGAMTYDAKRARFLASMLGTFVNDMGEKHTNAWTPAFFMTIYPLNHSRDLEIRAFYKKIFRMPTFNDLYYTDIGNISLRPEYTTQTDIGFTWQHQWKEQWLKRFEIRADGYLNQVDDKIVAIPKGNSQYRWMMMNIGRVEIKGLEVQLRSKWEFSRDWSMEACGNYTYQRAEDRTDPNDNAPIYGTYGGQIAYIPRQATSCMGNITWRNLSLNYSFIYTGERYHNSSNILQNREEPWYTHDASVSYRWIPNTDTRFRALCLTLEVNNLADQQYDVVLNYPMPGRNFKAIVTCEF